MFKERKWKLALDAMPLDEPKAIQVKKSSDLLILRARASEYGAENNKKVSVNIDFDAKQAIVTVTKR